MSNRVNVKRVGMYNRWLFTMGGGEKHSLAIAEYLSQFYPVTVITHTPVDKESLESRLDLDLSGVEIKVMPEKSNEELSQLTAQFSLFINASHMDFLLARSARKAMLVYFPVPLPSSHPVLRFKRQAGRILRRWLMVPFFRKGVFGVEYANGKQVRRTGSRVEVELPYSPVGYKVRFSLASYAPGIERAEIFLNGDLVGELRFPGVGEFQKYEVWVPPSLPGTSPYLIIRAEPCGQIPAERPYRLILTDFEVLSSRYSLYRLLFERIFKELGLRLHGIPPEALSEIVRTYDLIWANSEFTRYWIRRYWGLDSSVLYPPVDVDKFRPLNKQPIILSVGRFFAGSHNKKHLVMIRAFKEMLREGLQGWELHLAGGTSSKNIHREYLEAVLSEARGYPIVIHTDLPFKKLRELYGKSTIYWHAAGYGQDENKNPIEFEHFGLTTVEAMASGCVPIVIGKGGQREIIRHGENGFTWETIEELKRYTWQIIKDPALREKLSSVAIADSRFYDKRHFQARLRDSLERIGVEIREVD